MLQTNAVGVELFRHVNIFFVVVVSITLSCIDTGHVSENTLKACLHGGGDPGLVGLVYFVFTLWGTQNKRNLPH